MQIITYKRWTFYADVTATREAYRALDRGCTEDCGCSQCLNFLANRNQVYPAEILALFSQLGIDYTKETEVYQLTRLDSGLHLYNGWLHFIGHFKSGIDSKVQIEEVPDTQICKLEFEPVDEHFQIGFTKDARSYWESFEGKPLVQIEFTVEIPWVLENEKEPL